VLSRLRRANPEPPEVVGGGYFWAAAVRQRASRQAKVRGARIVLMFSLLTVKVTGTREALFSKHKEGVAAWQWGIYPVFRFGFFVSG